jgi:hypothetical protein
VRAADPPRGDACLEAVGPHSLTPELAKALDAPLRHSSTGEIGMRDRQAHGAHILHAFSLLRAMAEGHGMHAGGLP